MSFIHRASNSHRRRLSGEDWTPLSPTPSGGHTPAHHHTSDGPLWQDAGITPATADGDPIGRWEDIATNADHANQPTAAKQPSLQNAAGDLLNGHPVIRFDGTADYLAAGFVTGGLITQPFTLFAVAALDAAAVNDGVHRHIADGQVGDGINYAKIRQSRVPAPDKWNANAGGDVIGSATDSSWHLWTVLFNGASSQFWLEGVSDGSGDGGAKGIDGLTIGASIGATDYWDGDIAEIIIYAAELDDADKNTVGQYLASRYGLTYTTI